MTQKDFFFCYNRAVMLYLKEKGFEFITCALHERTKCKFWLFAQSDELSKALKEYKLMAS